jgi:hypothetical protein
LPTAKREKIKAGRLEAGGFISRREFQSESSPFVQPIRAISCDLFHNNPQSVGDMANPSGLTSAKRWTWVSAPEHEKEHLTLVRKDFTAMVSTF